MSAKDLRVNCVVIWVLREYNDVELNMLSDALPRHSRSDWTIMNNLITLNMKKTKNITKISLTPSSSIAVLQEPRHNIMKGLIERPEFEFATGRKESSVEILVTR